MSSDTDRMARAGNYVMGLMDADERERAERDLERDQSFRDAVLRTAERLQMFSQPDASAVTRWNEVSSHLSALPQMRGTMRSMGIPLAPRPQAVTWRRSRPLTAALGLVVLVATFALGYIAGQSSSRELSSVPPSSLAEPAR